MSPDLLDVSVTTRYIDDQSAPDRDSYVFTYSVTIKNKGAGRRAIDCTPLDHYGCQ